MAHFLAHKGPTAYSALTHKGPIVHFVFRLNETWGLYEMDKLGGTDLAYKHNLNSKGISKALNEICLYTLLDMLYHTPNFQKNVFNVLTLF